MGVVHKLKPQVADFILELKSTRPDLGCRTAAQITQAKFNLPISKSCVNSLFKNSGVSMPVGRRRKLRQGSVEYLGLGTLFLQAADAMLGGIPQMSRAIEQRIKISGQEAQAHLEYLIYAPLVPAQARELVLPELAGKKLPAPERRLFLEATRLDRELSWELMRVIAAVCKPVRYARFQLSDGESYFLDGQMHTVWSRPRVPQGLAMPLGKVKSDLQAILRNEAALSLLLAPGYEAPTREFMNLVRSFQGQNPIAKITLCGDDAREVETLTPPDGDKKLSFVCGVWPWQFQDAGALEVTSPFRRYLFLPLKKEFFIAAAEVRFAHPSGQGIPTLYGVALKPTQEAEVSLVIAGNMSQDQRNMDTVANEYLGHWQDPEAIFKAYSQKIQAFAQAQEALPPYPTYAFPSQAPAQPEFMEIISYYRELLDWHVRSYFFPPEYAHVGLAAMQERFYSLKAVFTPKKGLSLVTYRPSPRYAFSPALTYACQRVNQMRLNTPGLGLLFLQD